MSAYNAKLNRSMLLSFFVGVGCTCTVVGGLALLLEWDEINRGKEDNSSLIGFSLFTLSSAAVAGYNMVQLNTEHQNTRFPVEIGG